MNRAPSAGYQMQNRPESHQRPAHVNAGLHNIGPDDGCQAALERIDERQCSDDCDRRHLARSQRDCHYNRHRIDSHPLRRRSCEQEQSGGQGAQPAPKAPFNQLIRRIEIAAKIMWQQHEADYDTPHEVSHHHL